MSQYNAESISRKLREELLSGVYMPNQMLAEREIAEKFQVSRVPVREALQRLCQEGYLIRFPRKGYLVNRLTEEYIRQFQQVRYHVESMALMIAIQKAGDAEIAALLQTPPGTEGIMDPYNTSNTYFHSSLGKLSGNQVLADTIYKNLRDTSLAVFQYPSLIEKQVNCHAEIVGAMLERDAEKALAALAKDMQMKPVLRYSYL
ncbi:GntR family transcriptional regulator [Papillibacter cinnamivorans]|uniref:DNA-binding transcriptional regulator, GntR family n=1 Tax=Papillibacter cinnamivorans DSM 12816 TaxID=1122930 RepID=A0A1W1ZCM6_9FIRM|nr:GntR family transcriptional regulator [Papillibacter cinnamivorans]SMC46153.1 DNA-binding transcriptional regulator, GntR family [Papillibacter cinnamivorans DSM 12816]